jgi:ornithine carbamoyltransferase
MRHFLEVDDLDRDELAVVLDLADDPEPPQVLAGKGMALVFEKPSARTRNSMEMAVVQLGGHPVSIRGEEVGIDVRESAEDVARTLACYHAAIGARVFEHGKLERMAAVSAVPIVNLLSDASHPMQALADLLTLRQRFGKLDSLALAGALSGMQVRIGSPAGYDCSAVDVDRARALGGDIVVANRPEEAVEGADAVYTDVWASMGQEAEAEARRRAFEGWTIDGPLMERAAPDAVFLHCLPAHRGEEAAGEVVDGERSLIWPQAENRMHAARGLLAFLLGPEGGR